MEEFTKEETISMLYAMLWMGGLTKVEADAIRAAIFYLEKGE